MRSVEFNVQATNPQGQVLITKKDATIHREITKSKNQKADTINHIASNGKKEKNEWKNGKKWTKEWEIGR